MRSRCLGEHSAPEGLCGSFRMSSRVRPVTARFEPLHVDGEAAGLLARRYTAPAGLRNDRSASCRWGIPGLVEDLVAGLHQGRGGTCRLRACRRAGRPRSRPHSAGRAHVPRPRLSLRAAPGCRRSDSSPCARRARPYSWPRLCSAESRIEHLPVEGVDFWPAAVCIGFGSTGKHALAAELARSLCKPPPTCCGVAHPDSPVTVLGAFDLIEVWSWRPSARTLQLRRPACGSSALPKGSDQRARQRRTR